MSLITVVLHCDRIASSFIYSNFAYTLLLCQLLLNHYVFAFALLDDTTTPYLPVANGRRALGGRCARMVTVTASDAAAPPGEAATGVDLERRNAGTYERPIRAVQALRHKDLLQPDNSRGHCNCHSFGGKAPELMVWRKIDLHLIIFDCDVI